MIEPSSAGPAITSQRAALERIWATPPGWGRLSAVNHSILGLRFIVTACVFFAIGGVLAMLVRAQLSTSRSAFMAAESYNQVFTMHGTVMMFLFAIPLIEGFAMYILPKLLGARDLAFPRLSAYGYWCYVLGGGMLIGAMLMGLAPDGGWFMYTPLTSRAFSPGINADVWLLGVTFVEISAICAAVELVVTILKLRAPGMTLARMPILAWYLLVTACMMLVGFPPLILGSILLELERAFDLPFFDPTRGGDPLLWQHLFWLFGHPEVYIIFLPAAGMVSTIVPVFAGRDLIGYAWIVTSIVALAFLSFGLWVHHMFVVGIPHLGLALFSAASLLVAVPTAVQVFAWIGTLAIGRPRLSVPMLWILGFFAIFVIGGLTGVMVAVAPFDWQAHDTHFVVAHLHYVLIGGFVFPAVAALYYWMPLASGRASRFGLGTLAFWLVFLGFNLTFFIMHLTGLLGMPRRIYGYAPEAGWDLLNLVSSIGSFVMAFGFALVGVDMLLQGRFGGMRGPDPWAAGTLEWATPVPLPSYTFPALPMVTTLAPLRDEPAVACQLAGDGFLAVARHGWQETLCLDPTTAEPDSVLVLPRPTFLPLWTALATGLFFAAMLLKAYALAPAALLVIAVVGLAWTRRSDGQADMGPLPIGMGLAVPPHWETARPPSWWAAVLVLGADTTLFISLAFGAVFLATVAPEVGTPEPLRGALAVTAVACGGLICALAGGALVPLRAASQGLALLGHAAAATALGWLALAIPSPHAHALGAVSIALVGYAMLHALLGMLFAAHGLFRCLGAIDARARLDLRIGALWHAYVCVTGVAAVLLMRALAATA
jgi:cytochrome c oxidase subunit I+III